MRRRAGRQAAAILGLALAACSASPTPSSTPTACPTAAPTAAEATTILAAARQVVVATSLGTFTIELDPSSAPIATANFVALARCGFYSGLTFHRVLAGFVAQAGDPQTRDNRAPFGSLGQGGPGYHFTVEFPGPNQTYQQYTVAMANAVRFDPVTGELLGGTDTNGSQFFIDLDSLAGRLRPYYSIIGRVTNGTAVIDAIGKVDVNSPSQGVPLEPVIIESVSIATGG
jgi:cyclophilin family peptidyl-prolyl cis-trans isomerase